MKEPRMFQALAKCGCVVSSVYDDDTEAVKRLAVWAAGKGLATRFSELREKALPFYCPEHDPKQEEK